MLSLDIRTIAFSFFLTSLMATLFMAAVWRASRERFSPTLFWLIGFVLQTIAFILVALRNVVPDFISIVMANIFIAIAAFIVFIGFERFVGRNSRRLYNYIILSIFTCLFIYFTFLNPDVAIRIILISSVVLLMFLQSSWLLLHSVRPELKRLTLPTGIACLIYVFVQFYRIVIASIIPYTDNYLDTNLFDSIGQLLNQMLGIVIIFVLVLMINHRMVQSILTNEETLLKQKLETENSNNNLQETTEKLLEANINLVNTNKELEAFSYSVSHDLMAPLRRIDGFSRAILETSIDKIDDQGKKYLQRISVNIKNMESMIENLLKLSRITNSEMKFEVVSICALAKSIASELQESQSGRNVKFLLPDKELDIKGDKALIRILLENLLGNAWKFTSMNLTAEIEMNTVSIEERQVFYVKDNGAGFDMTDAEKLFAPFQRLHSAEEFPGIGIGLATVQRIIHRHGGRVWAEGEIGKGATIFFTFAKDLYVSDKKLKTQGA